MKYRNLPHGGEKLSVIGMGTSVLPEDQKTAVATIDTALDSGVNMFDLAGTYSSGFKAFGTALKGRRDDAYLQFPVGADYLGREYGWTDDYDTAVRSFEWQMKTVGTDYCDFAFIHCIDTESDLKRYREQGILKYIQDRKKDGSVRHIALSTHNPAIAEAVLDMGIIDLMMFSINPLYDYGIGDLAMGRPDERNELYVRCEKEGVAITVMKAFNRGQLLDPEQTPFEHALTVPQCIEYALRRPAVTTVIAGVENPGKMKEVLSYLDCDDKDRDYSVMGRLKDNDYEQRCCYCGHCHPCPAGINVALVNKYYDLAVAGDGQAVEHYRNLDRKASDCTGCGHCDRRCPFGVTQTRRMNDISDYFDKLS